MCDGDPELLFCENETNSRRLYGTNAVGFFKDGISDYVVGGDLAAVNPDRLGTKAAALYRLTLPAEGLRRRLAPGTPGLADFDAAMRQRRTEANEFYDALQRDIADPDTKLVQRQAARRHAVVEAALLLRHPRVGTRRSAATRTAAVAKAGTQPRPAAPE